MINELTLSDSQKHQMVEEVWNLIATTIEESLPSIINEVIEEHFDDVLSSDANEDVFNQIASSLGPLAFS